MTDPARHHEAMTNPALRQLDRGAGQWWGLAAVAAGIVVLAGSILILSQDGGIATIDTTTTLDRFIYAANSISVLPLGLAITSLLVEASRRFALLAIGAWALAEAIGFARTLLDETPFG